MSITKFTVWVTMQNSDQTEGRGTMVPVSYWITEDLAVQDAQGRGVMGVGPGEVRSQTFIVEQDTGKVNVEEVKTYGYRRDPFNKWSYGYMDLREHSDVVQTDEYAEYLRLSAKYGG